MGESNPIITISLAHGGEIKIELYPQIAPNTVNNFISLASKGFYDSLTFHRIIMGFAIQGGDPDGDGLGGPGYYIRGEFSNNGFDNPLTLKQVLYQWQEHYHMIQPGASFSSYCRILFIWMVNMLLLAGL